MSLRPKRIPPAILALLLQFAAFILALLAVRLSGLQPTPLVFALFCGALAAILSRIAGLAFWWLLIQFAFAPALVLMLALHIPPAFFLVAFLVMLAVYWSTFRTQVPLYLSSNKVWQALESRLPADQPFSLIDLGSGIGGVLTYLAQKRPLGHYHGIESAPLPFLWSWLRIRFGGHRDCSVHWGSFWDHDLSQYDVVFAYLSPVPMKALWEKARNEMRPGSLFISNTFAVPDHPPQETISVDDLHQSTLFLWRM
ncbi:MAG: class I SAM-dependent methyltransferase [Nitrosomonadales bacterium]|nr:class I SAM-dependent methyltransferase [Nitrosomonadales bacterium]